MESPEKKRNNKQEPQSCLSLFLKKSIFCQNCLMFKDKFIQDRIVHLYDKERITCICFSNCLDIHLNSAKFISSIIELSSLRRLHLIDPPSFRKGDLFRYLGSNDCAIDHLCLENVFDENAHEEVDLFIECIGKRTNYLSIQFRFYERLWNSYQNTQQLIDVICKNKYLHTLELLFCNGHIVHNTSEIKQLKELIYLKTNVDISLGIAFELKKLETLIVGTSFYDLVLADYELGYLNQMTKLKVFEGFRVESKMKNGITNGSIISSNLSIAFENREMHNKVRSIVALLILHQCKIGLRDKNVLYYICKLVYSSKTDIEIWDKERFQRAQSWEVAEKHKWGKSMWNVNSMVLPFSF